MILVRRRSSRGPGRREHQRRRHGQIRRAEPGAAKGREGRKDLAEVAAQRLLRRGDRPRTRGVEDRRSRCGAQGGDEDGVAGHGRGKADTERDGEVGSRRLEYGWRSMGSDDSPSAKASPFSRSMSDPRRRNPHPSYHALSFAQANSSGIRSNPPASAGRSGLACPERAPPASAATQLAVRSTPLILVDGGVVYA